MFLIAGLGNPEKKYEETRHNAGFAVVEKIGKENGFPDFIFSKKMAAEVSEGKIKDKKVLLIRPMTFMNLSGRAVSKIARFHKISPESTIVVHDDIDIPLGQIKVAKSRGSGGHKGVNSIIKEIGSKGFIRIRVGICPEEKPRNAEIFVLQKFKKNEENKIKAGIEKAVEAINTITESGPEKAASLFNVKEII